ncbi:MAG: D-aminoacyl-tRNA deacylase [Acidiferrobacterales bacterium]|nr:D-aminoacyl-tRNA deacylase [Acidiferrobacterales bacterium]
MRVLAQRVLGASVVISGETAGEIGRGLLLFVGFTHNDNSGIVRELANKVVNLRIFEDAERRLQHSVLESGGAVLAVPQFTLYASTDRGRRPDFTQAMEPQGASDLFDEFARTLDELLKIPIARGRFGMDMKVSLVNDGPFTITLQRDPT